MAVFTCPQCGHSQAVDDKHIGRNATCPKCKTQGVVQGSPSLPATSVEPDEPEHIAVRRETKGKLGLHYAPNPKLSVLNDDSTISREWIVIDACGSPVQFVSVCGIDAVVDEEGMKTGVVQYAYKTAITLRNRETAVTAVEMRFLTFDVWGGHIRTLSAEAIADIKPHSEYAHSAKWRLYSLGEGWKHLASIGYIARVRDADGHVWTADTNGILREAQRFSEKFTEADLEPSAPKKSNDS